MFKLWLSNKFRILSVLVSFLCGLLSPFLPWYIFLVVLAVALFLDYLAYSTTYGGMGD